MTVAHSFANFLLAGSDLGQGKAGSDFTALTNEKVGRATGASANHPRLKKKTQANAAQATLESRYHCLKIQTEYK